MVVIFLLFLPVSLWQVEVVFLTQSRSTIDVSVVVVGAYVIELIMKCHSIMSAKLAVYLPVTHASPGNEAHTRGN